jgi:hypothetical protein
VTGLAVIASDWGARYKAKELAVRKLKVRVLKKDFMIGLLE